MASSLWSALTVVVVSAFLLVGNAIISADARFTVSRQQNNSSNYLWDLSWVAGVEYTPARAPGNSLWWNKFDEYRPDVERELAAASKLYGFNHLRMFLHDMVFDVDNGASLHANMDAFLTIAVANGFKVSFVFFDDCWNHAGASLEQACVPVKGRHNGCWMAIPQDVDRTSVDRFRNYVYNTVLKFSADDRVAFWEIFNEPQNSNEYSMSLRHAAFQWAQDALREGAGNPVDYVQKVPVLSCWDNNIDTQVSDMHRYDTNFVSWTDQVFIDVEHMNTLITEGGSRWYQGYPSDAGSPLTVLHWYNHLKSITPSAAAPFNFGIVLNWELMVGESNTRWHWDTPDNSAEPVIPWDAHMFPDLTPVSYVEAAVIRNWTRGVNDLIAYDSFLPDTHLFAEDRYLCLNPSQGYAPTIAAARKVVGKDGETIVVETTVWPSQNVGGGILIQTIADGDVFVGYFAGFRDGGNSGELTIEEWKYNSVEGSKSVSSSNASSYAVSASVRNLNIVERTVLSTFDMTTLDCGMVTNGWNMLRVEISPKWQLSVFANPMYTEALTETGIAPRLVVDIHADRGVSGGAQLAKSVLLVGSATDTSSDAACTRFDYVGVLPKTFI